MRTTPDRIAVALVLSIAAAGCSESEVDEWRLPVALREVSGLAVTGDDRLFTVTDEKAVVYELAIDTGDVRTLAVVGDPALDDFEGIEIVDDDIFLISSKGMLYHVPGGLVGGRISRYTVTSTGLEDVCEVEGLGRDGDDLLIACKRNYRKVDDHSTIVFAWSMKTNELRRYFSISREFNASGIAKAGNRYYIVAAKQERLVIVDAAGHVLDVRKLKGHRQAEGVAVLSDGTIVIADEGNNKGGKITRYREVSDIPE